DVSAGLTINPTAGVLRKMFCPQQSRSLSLAVSNLLRPRRLARSPVSTANADVSEPLSHISLPRSQRVERRGGAIRPPSGHPPGRPARGIIGIDRAGQVGRVDVAPRWVVRIVGARS